MKRCAILVLVVALGCERAPNPAPVSAGQAPAVAGRTPPPGKGEIRPGTFIPWVEPGRSVDEWLKDLREGDNNARWQARYNLARMRAQAVPKLAEMLGSADAVLRQRAAWALGSMGEEAAGALEPLVKALHDPAPDVARTAADAFRWMGAKGAPAAPALVRMLLDGPDQLRITVAQALVGALGAAGEAALIEGLRDADTEKLAQAFGSLDGQMTGTEDYAVWLLDRALRTHADPAVRRQAVQVLTRFHRDRSLACGSLLRALFEDTDAGVRAACARLLGRLCGDDDLDLCEAALPALREAAKDPDPAVARAATVAARRAVPNGNRLFQNEASRKEEEALVLLKRGEREPAARLYRELLEEHDDDEHAGQWREALERIGSAAGGAAGK